MSGDDRGRTTVRQPLRQPLRHRSIVGLGVGISVGVAVYTAVRNAPAPLRVHVIGEEQHHVLVEFRDEVEVLRTLGRDRTVSYRGSETSPVSFAQSMS